MIWSLIANVVCVCVCWCVNVSKGATFILLVCKISMAGLVSDFSRACKKVAVDGYYDREELRVERLNDGVVSFKGDLVLAMK